MRFCVEVLIVSTKSNPEDSPYESGIFSKANQMTTVPPGMRLRLSG